MNLKAIPETISDTKISASKKGHSLELKAHTASLLPLTPHSSQQAAANLVSGITPLQASSSMQSHGVQATPELEME